MPSHRRVEGLLSFFMLIQVKNNSNFTVHYFLSLIFISYIHFFPFFPPFKIGMPQEKLILEKEENCFSGCQGLF